jgi:hypothetical protein
MEAVAVDRQEYPAGKNNLNWQAWRAARKRAGNTDRVTAKLISFACIACSGQDA